MHRYVELAPGKWKCLLCERCFGTRQATTSHIHRTHDNPGAVYGHKTKGSIPWNKGLTAEIDERVKRNGESVSKTLKHKVDNGTFVPNRPGEKARRKTSERQSLKNSGGKSKWYDVGGQKVQGTWERNVALKFNELSIKWVKCKCNKDIIKYTIDDTEKSYTPDFYLPEYDLFLEIKGYWWGDDKRKMDAVLSQTDKNILIIEKCDYERILGGELVW